MQNSPLSEKDVWKKIDLAHQCLGDAMDRPHLFSIPGPDEIARDVSVVQPIELPPKKGLSSSLGQARLVHDLASIELQAMELAFRTLVEYPEAPEAFREELSRIMISEAEHLRLCLLALEKLGSRWGDWAVHTALWKAVRSQDSLLDRVLIVHRYLEGSGLDAGDTLLRRLYILSESPSYSVVQTIVRDEVGHVEFGSRWYRDLCEQEGIDPQEDFSVRTEKLRYQVPRRMEPISWILRKKAGFSELELEYLEVLRGAVMGRPPSKPMPPSDIRHLIAIFPEMAF